MVKKKIARKKSYLVFISHSSKDNFIARQLERLIKEKCRKHGIKTFLDEKDIKGGDPIAEVIKSNIQNCNELLVLLSRYSIDRPWVLTEIGAAWGLDKRIVAIIDKVTPEEMSDIRLQYKAIDLNLTLKV
jgi:TIR domain